MNTGKLYIFTEGGKCHQIKAMSVPMGRYNDKGVPLEQVSALTTDEVAVAVISDYKPKEKLLFVTRKGYVKRVVISEFDTTRKTTDATKLSKEDSVFAVLPIKEKKSVVIISKQKLCVSFELSSVSLLKKATVGVVGMKFDKNDEVDFVTTTPDGNFDYNNKRYNLDKLNAGKRATKGKKI